MVSSESKLLCQKDNVDSALCSMAGLAGALAGLEVTSAAFV